MIELIQNSTIHGINHIYSASSKIIKLFWSFLLLSSIIGIIINVCFVVIKYKSTPISVSYTPIDEDFIWPDLTICFPSSPYELDRSRVYNHWKQTTNSPQSIIQRVLNVIIYSRHVLGIISEDLESAVRMLAMSSADPQQLDVGQFIYDRIYAILYTELPWRTTRELYLSYMREMLNKAYSTRIHQLPNNVPCYTLDMNKLFELNKINSQIISSLNIYLNFNQKSHQIFNSSYHGRSVFLYLHRKNEFSTDNPILIYPGHTNHLTISQTRYHYLVGGKSNCRNDSYQEELYDALLQSTRLFDIDYHVDCLNIARQMHIVKGCKCYNPSLPIYKNKTGFPRLCLNTTIFSYEQIDNNVVCISNVVGIYKWSDPSTLLSKCEKYSRIKCDSINYKVEKEKMIAFESSEDSSDDWWSRFLKNRFYSLLKSKNKSATYQSTIRDNLVEIEIAKYPHKGDSYKEEYSYRFSELLSDIGGLMGLWLGMSIVGMFEAVQLVCLYFNKICFKSKNVSPPSPQSGTLAEPIQSSTDNKLL